MILINVIFLHKKVCQHLDDLYNLVNQYFLNNQCILFQNHACFKIHFKYKIDQQILI